MKQVTVMNGVLVVRLGFPGTAFKPLRSFMYLSLQQFIAIDDGGVSMSRQ